MTSYRQYVAASYPEHASIPTYNESVHPVMLTADIYREQAIFLDYLDKRVIELYNAFPANTSGCQVNPIKNRLVDMQTDIQTRLYELNDAITLLEKHVIR